MVLEQLEPLCQAEQYFCRKFFALDTVTNVVDTGFGCDYDYVYLRSQVLLLLVPKVPME